MLAKDLSKFCTRVSRSTFFNDNNHHAFSLAYTISPNGVHQPPAIISQKVEDDEFPEVQWFTTPNALKPGKPPTKWNCQNVVYEGVNCNGINHYIWHRTSTVSMHRDHTDLQLTDDPLLDPYAIVTGISNTSAHRSIQPTDSKKQLQRLALPPTNMAASEGDDLTTPSNAPLFRPDNGKDANAERDSALNSSNQPRKWYQHGLQVTCTQHFQPRRWV